MKKIYFLFVISIILVLSGCSKKALEVKKNDFESFKININNLVENEMKKNKLVNISFILADENGEIWSNHYGYSDISNNAKASGNSIYRIGSVSKVFTSLAVLQLYEKGLINLNDPITKYIPDLKIKTRFENDNITIKNVIMHNAGFISDVIENWFVEEPFENIVNYLNEEYTINPPGYKFAYSNPGYDLLGILIQNVAGLKYDEYIKKNIFDVLEMKNTDVYPVNEEFYAKAFDKNKNQLLETRFRSVPAGLIHSTTEDMKNFIIMLLNKGVYNNNRLLNEETILEYSTIQNGNSLLDLDIKLGLGWFIDDTITGSRVILHGGDTTYYHSMLKIDTENNIGVFITSSSENSASSVLKISHEILKNYMKYKGNEIIAPKRNDDFKYEKISDEEKTKISGYYSGEPGLIKVESLKNNLKIDLMGNILELSKRNDGLYQARYKILFFPIKLKDVVFGFKEIDGHEVIYQKLNNNMEILLGTKIEKPKEFIDIWKNRIGKYIPNFHNQTLAIEYFEVTEKHGFLTGKVEIYGNTFFFPLKPISETEAIVMGHGRNLGGTITYSEKDNKHYIQVFGSEFYN